MFGFEVETVMHEPGHTGRSVGPSIDVFVQYQTLGNWDDALEGHDLTAYFIVWRLLLELDQAGASAGISTHDFEIWRGSEVFHFVVAYEVQKQEMDIRLKVSLIRGSGADLADVQMSDDLRRQLKFTTNRQST
jgi:hypothetical protein